MPEMVPVLPEDAGSVVIDLDGPVEAGSYQRFTLTYSAGRYGIDDTGSIKVCFRFASDMGKPQLDDPAAANFVSVAASNGATLATRFDLKGNTRPWDRTLHVKIVAGFMREGDTLRIAFGTDPRGPGMQMQTFVDPDFAFRVLVDPIATYTFVEVAGSPMIPIEPGPAHRWYAVLPTLRAAGGETALAIRADDAWGNPTWKHGARVLHLRAHGPLEKLPETIPMPGGAIPLLVKELALPEPGTVHVEVLDETGALLCRSNPLVIEAAPRLAAFWGDLHAQSGETIGSGTAEAYFRYARDYAFLDAVGHQGNDFQITPAFWTRLNRLMDEWDEPGRFVTAPGYEWSGNTALGGDRNVFFETSDRPIRRSSHALVAARDDVDTDCWNARELFAALTPEQSTTVVWAHCGGRYADIGFAHDAKLERSVEVHSSWGTFEWLLEDAFDLGYRVGVVANSDGHKGRPGSEPPGSSMFGALGGLTCYLLPELTRPALFAAMRARHHYGTTGCRLHLAVAATWDGEGIIWTDDPRIEGACRAPGASAIMGDIVQLRSASVTFTVTVEAASPIMSLEVRRGHELLETIRPERNRPPGRRVRIEWAGAEYRGRARQTVWDGSATAIGGAINEATAINFLNPERPLRRTAPDRVAWSSITTGNFAGVDLILSEDATGIALETPHVCVESLLSDLGADPLVLDCGKLGRKVRLSRPAEMLEKRSLCEEFRIDLGPGDNPLYVCATLEDGHQAWSSPIYFVRKD